MKTRPSLIILLIFTVIGFLSTIDFKRSDTVWMGTAWFLNDQGYIVTAYHVVKGSKHFTFNYRNQVQEAYIFAVDYQNDIAILKTFLQNTPYLMIDSNITDGEPDKTYGFPRPLLYGDDLKISTGLIYNSWGTEYRSTARTCPGNSGGPVIGKDGVLGIVNYGMPLFDKDGCSTHSYGTKSGYVVTLAHRNGIFVPVTGGSYPSSNTIFEIFAY